MFCRTKYVMTDANVNLCESQNKDMPNFVFGPFVMVENQAECYLLYYIDTVPIVELQFKMAYMVS